MLCRLFQILRHAGAVVIHNRDTIKTVGVFAGCSGLVIGPCLRQILLHSFAIFVHAGKFVCGSVNPAAFNVACRGQLHPFEGFDQICFDAVARSILFRQLDLGIEISLFGGIAEKGHYGWIGLQQWMVWIPLWQCAGFRLRSDMPLSRRL